MEVIFFNNILDPSRPFLVLLSNKLNPEQDLRLQANLREISNLSAHPAIVEVGSDEEASEGSGSDSDREAAATAHAAAESAAPTDATAPAPLVVTDETPFCSLELNPIGDSGPIYLICINFTAEEIRRRIKATHPLYALFPEKGLHYSFSKMQTLLGTPLKRHLSPEDEIGPATDLYIASTEHPLLAKPSAHGLHLEPWQRELVFSFSTAWRNFLENQVWNYYRQTPPHFAAPSTDALGFFAADPLRLLVNIVCRSQRNKVFFWHYFTRRLLSNPLANDPLYIDDVRLTIIEKLIKHCILGPEQAQYNILSMLKAIFTTEFLPLQPALAKKLASCHYDALLTALVTETAIPWSTLPVMLAAIKLKLDAGPVATFKAAHSKLVREIDDARIDFSFRFIPWQPKLDDLRLLDLLNSYFDPASLSTFFAEFFADLLSVPVAVVDIDKYFRDILSTLRDKIKALYALLLAELPSSVFNREMEASASWILLIQTLEHYSTFTTDAAISSILDRTAADYRRPLKRSIGETLAYINRIFQQEYQKTLPSCLQRTLGTRALEISSTGLMLGAYSALIIDFITDNFVNAPLMDKLMEGLFSLLFLMAAVSRLMDKLPREVFAHYGRSPSMSKSFKDLGKNRIFLAKAVGAVLSLVLSLGFYFFAKYGTGKPTAHNDTLNLIAVIFFTLLEYLAIALGIETGLSLLAVPAEHALIQRQLHTRFMTVHAPPDAVVPVAPAAGTEDGASLSLLAGAAMSDVSTATSAPRYPLPLRTLLSAEAAVIEAPSNSAAAGAGAR